MSRLAKKPIEIPKGVEVKVEGNTVTVKGPKGTLIRELHPFVRVETEDGKVWVKPNMEVRKRKSDERRMKAFQGTFWSHIRNMIIGVTKGYEKKLAVVGIGYRASNQGRKLILNLGYAHPIEFEPPEGINITTERDSRTNWTVITVSGIDKELVGQTAANIRSFREPDPYKGKGVRYLDEIVRTKVGKKV